MITLLRAAAILSTILFIALTGCATPQYASDSMLSAAEQKGHPASPDDRCPQLKRKRSYFEPCTSSTSRDPNTPIHHIPGSVQIISRELINDQKALTIGNALRNVSGVQSGR